MGAYFFNISQEGGFIGGFAVYRRCDTRSLCHATVEAPAWKSERIACKNSLMGRKMSMFVEVHHLLSKNVKSNEEVRGQAPARPALRGPLPVPGPAEA